MYMKLLMYPFFFKCHTDLMILIGANPLLGPLEWFLGPKWHSLRSWPLQGPKSQGPPLPMALVMDLPAKSLRPEPYTVNKRYINSYYSPLRN